MTDNIQILDLKTKTSYRRNCNNREVFSPASGKDLDFPPRERGIASYSNNSLIRDHRICRSGIQCQFKDPFGRRTNQLGIDRDNSFGDVNQIGGHRMQRRTPWEDLLLNKGSADDVYPLTAFYRSHPYSCYGPAVCLSGVLWWLDPSCQWQSKATHYGIFYGSFQSLVISWMRKLFPLFQGLWITFSTPTAIGFSTLRRFIPEMFLVKLDPDKNDKGNYDNDGKGDPEGSHLSISFPSNVSPTINGITVAKMPNIKIQNVSPEGFAICAITKAAKSILAISYKNLAVLSFCFSVLINGTNKVYQARLEKSTRRTAFRPARLPACSLSGLPACQLPSLPACTLTRFPAFPVLGFQAFKLSRFPAFPLPGLLAFPLTRFPACQLPSLLAYLLPLTLWPFRATFKTVCETGFTLSGSAWSCWVVARDRRVAAAAPRSSRIQSPSPGNHPRSMWMELPCRT